MLDAMMQLMLGEGAPEFDREYLSELSSCMETISPSLEAVSNGAWLGLISYHDTDGVVVLGLDIVMNIMNRISPSRTIMVLESMSLVTMQVIWLTIMLSPAFVNTKTGAFQKNIR